MQKRDLHSQFCIWCYFLCKWSLVSTFKTYKFLDCNFSKCLKFSIKILTLWIRNWYIYKDANWNGFPSTRTQTPKKKHTPKNDKNLMYSDDCTKWSEYRHDRRTQKPPKPYLFMHTHFNETCIFFSCLHIYSIIWIIN